MKLLKLAVEKQRWDLAAHTIVLAAARTLNKGDKPYASQSTPKSKRIKGKPETGRLLPQKVLDEAERIDFELVSGVNGIDDEIALLRVKIKSILDDDPKNIKLIVEATNALERLIRTKYKISKEQRKGLKEAIGNVLRDVALPLGIGIATTISK